VVRLGKGRGEKTSPVVDEESAHSYISSTFSRNGLWELWGIVLCRDAERSGMTVACDGCRLTRQMNGGRSNKTAHPRSIPAFRERAGNKLTEKTLDLRAVVRKKLNQRAQADPPPQVIRNLNVFHWLSSACRKSCREGKHMEMGHGIARTAKSLRELRLPVVSSTNSKERLLQGLRIQAERVSLAG
jgi:hypothetical protein